MSQIGYMIMGVGIGAYEGGVAHFFTHAFFKAQLFLGSGLIIHALANEQDVRKMGGLVKKLPFAFVAMATGVLAICGIPGFSGFFSKDQVIYGALEHGHPWLYAVGIVTAGITAYYMCRMLFITFLGSYRGEVDPSDLGMRHPELAGTAGNASFQTLAPQDDTTEVHAHAPAWYMNLPVAILIVPTVLIGWLMFGGENSPWAHFFTGQFPLWHPAPTAISELATTGIVLVVVLIGIGLAYWRYATAPALADAVPRLREESIRMPALLTNLFYFDAAIDLLFVRPAQLLGTVFGRFLDPHVIDGGVRDVAAGTRWLGALTRSFQTGLVRAYALFLVFGAMLFLAYYAFAGGSR